MNKKLGARLLPEIRDGKKQRSTASSARTRQAEPQLRRAEWVDQVVVAWRHFTGTNHAPRPAHRRRIDQRAVLARWTENRVRSAPAVSFQGDVAARSGPKRTTRRRRSIRLLVCFSIVSLPPPCSRRGVVSRIIANFCCYFFAAIEIGRSAHLRETIIVTAMHG